MVRACVRLGFGSAAGLLEVSEGDPGCLVGKPQAPGLGVPWLRRPVSCGRRDPPGPVALGRVAECLTRRWHGKRGSHLGSSPVDLPLELTPCDGLRVILSTTEDASPAPRVSVSEGSGSRAARTPGLSHFSSPSLSFPVGTMGLRAAVLGAPHVGGAL